MLFFRSDMAPHVFSCLLHMRSSRAVRDFGDKGHVINFFFIFYPKVSREMDTLKHTETHFFSELQLNSLYELYAK